MGMGEFKEPPPGPKIGPTKNISELPPEQREEYGDIERLKAESVAAGQPNSGAAAPDEQARVEEGVERLDALRTVLNDEPEADPLDEEAEPTIADRQEFMRCVLGDTYYTKDYQLFGGMITLRLRDLSPDQEDVLFAALAKQQRDGELETLDDWGLMLDRLRMVAGIEQMVWSGKDVLTSIDVNKTDVLSALKNLMATFKTATVYRAALRTVRVFRRHLDMLVERAGDSDFWIAGGPDSQSEPTSEEQ